MAIPKVFISSTCYDLKYIRENLKYFISNLGYEAILSEDGDVFYNPSIHTHDSCLAEVSNCQIFVLIIGGRYGGSYRTEEKSITNKEYEEAIKLKIPVFTLVEQGVLAEHFVYQKNRENPSLKDMIYPSVDNVKIFEFIDEVRKNDTNNAIVPFADFNNIEEYLKKQWAGMMCNFLTNTIETKKVEELFSEIHSATEKIEFYTKQLAMNTGDGITSVLIKCYESMIENKAVQNLNLWGIKVTPYKIIHNQTLDDICSGEIEVEEEDGDRITGGGPPYKCTKRCKLRMEEHYKNIHDEIISIIEQNGFKLEDVIEN